MKLPLARHSSVKKRWLLPYFLLALMFFIHGLVAPIQAVENTWKPRQQPVYRGAVEIGLVFVAFPDSKKPVSGIVESYKNQLDNINGLPQKEYFDRYTNHTAWPKIVVYPSEKDQDIFMAPQPYGYYCEYDFWTNPMGYTGEDEGAERVRELKKLALAAAAAKNRKMKPQVLAMLYMSDLDRDPATRLNINEYYISRCDQWPEFSQNAQKKKKKTLPEQLTRKGEPYDPWVHYNPIVEWGHPMWPNSSIQLNSPSPSTLAHEFGHCLGAPDCYRMGRGEDGIGGTGALKTYGPTFTAFARYYHHAYLKEKNYPTITAPGTYTLYPRCLNPEGEEAVGFIIPSRHPHYYYHIEYVYGEHSALSVPDGAIDGNASDKHARSSGETQTGGILISVFNPLVSSYKASPDPLYTYRIGDDYFRGKGDFDSCWFGEKYGRTEFSMETTPSSRLPNLLDGGVRIANIQLHEGTATFDVELDNKPLGSSEYKFSLIPQIKLEQVDQILPTSFHMTCLPKFRGEPFVERYGFCWSTGKKPTIKQDNYTLMHRESYEGRALNLKPNTTYHIRAWAANSIGLRYSDEEITVKTQPGDINPDDIAPLLLDKYSNCYMMHKRCHKGTEGYNLKSYAATAVIAKLLAYYRPEKLALSDMTSYLLESNDKKTLKRMARRNSSKKSVMDFSFLHRDPLLSDQPFRTEPTLNLFYTAFDMASRAGMHEQTLKKNFLPVLNKNLGMGMKNSVKMLLIDPEKKEPLLANIRKELTNSRPVLIVQVQKADYNLVMQWGIIDGLKDGNLIHVDFPLGNSRHEKQTDYVELGDLVENDLNTYVITGISLQ